MPGKSNKQLESEHKSIEHKPHDLKDTDVESEYGGDKANDKQTGAVASQTGSGEAAVASKPPEPSSSKSGAKGDGGGGGGSSQRPEELKDTDVEDEFKETQKSKNDDKGGFRKNTDKARL